jgi:hypothetical protein
MFNNSHGDKMNIERTIKIERKFKIRDKFPKVID